jgi:hypothetical protein
MAWLGTDALPIGAGWAPEPQLHAPDIGSLVRAVLENRQFQQTNTEKNIADTIKQLQAQQQSGAYGQALQNAGIVPQGVDVSGMSSVDLARLSSAIQDQTPDTDEDAAKQAIANYHNAAANSLWTYPGGKGTAGVDYSEHAPGDMWNDPDTGIKMRMTRYGPVPLNPSLQSPDVRPQNQNQQMSEQIKLMQRQTQLDQLQKAEEAANIKALKPNVPFSAADEYNTNAARLRQLQQPHADRGAPINTGDPQRDAAVKYLNDNGLPVTEANIQHYQDNQ